jgi:predicted GNAT family acetyltransferase
MLSMPYTLEGDPMSSEHLPVSEKLIDDTDRGRFELYRDGELVGWLYRTHLKPNRYALVHTEVESSHQHQGVGGAMVRRVLDEIRAREGTITAICPFVADYLSRTTTHADLIDARHPGYTDRAAAESAHAKAGD